MANPRNRTSRKQAPAARRAHGPGAEALAEYVEFAGLSMERLGMPRIAGKLVGYLLVCDPPQQTQAQLVSALGASKGSVSMIVRQLEQSGVIDRVRPPGEKVDYWRVPNAGFSESMVRQMELRRRTVGELVSRGLSLLDGTPLERTQRLRSVAAFHEFMNAELHQVVERWMARGGATSPSPRNPKSPRTRAAR